MTYTITVNTPIGEKTGTAVLHAKSWVGWLCFIPYPAAADRREEKPSLPNGRIEDDACHSLLVSLLKQFPYEQYSAYKNKKENKRLAEVKRTEEKQAKLLAALEKRQYEEVITGAKQEMNGLLHDNGKWEKIIENVNRKLCDDIGNIKDSERLAKLFTLSNTQELKDKI